MGKEITLSTNIIKKNIFYYHPFLQNGPSAPIKYVDKKGNIKTKNPDKFYLTIKERITIEDILSYIYNKNPYIMNSIQNPSLLKTHIGQLLYIQNTAIKPIINMENRSSDIWESLDVLLFTINAASALSLDNEKPIYDILGLKDYIRDGISLYLEKRNECKMAGIDHVIC